MPPPPHFSTVQFGPITFDASFDSGNGAKVEQTGTDEFSVWTTPDAAGTPHEKQFRVWFHFAVRGVARGRQLTFVIYNMNNLGKLFRHDMRPVYRALPSKPKWSRLPLPTTQINTQKGDENFTLTFKHKFDAGADDTVFFAFCFPLTYADSIARLAYLDHLFGLPHASVLPLGMRPPPPPPASTGSPAASAPSQSPPTSGRTSGGGFGLAAKAYASSNRAAATNNPAIDETILAVTAARETSEHKAPSSVLSAALEAAATLGDAKEGSMPSPFSSLIASEIAAAAASYAVSMAPRAMNGKSSSNKGGDSIYYHRELLTRSLDGRRIDLITISGMNGICEGVDESLGLHEEGGQRSRSFIADKPIFFMSARVHPGETPASHVLDGLLEFLLRPDDPRAVMLRSLFVFKLVPMVNPDGVHRGHYRADTLGQNLNRCYGYATVQEHPSVYAIRQAIKRWDTDGKLKVYIDTHGHATKRGCFLYGNALDDFDRMVENVLFARVVAANCRWFDFSGCCFTERNMYRPDQRDGLSKEGSGRVAVYRMTGLTHVYTLECSYNTGRMVNRLNPPHTPKGRELIAGLDKDRILGLSPPPPPSKANSPKYTPESWRCVGRSLANAYLDLMEACPISRLGGGANGAGGLRGLRGYIGAWVRTQQKKAAEKAKAGGGGAGKAKKGDDEDDEDDDEDGPDVEDVTRGFGNVCLDMGGEPELRGEEEAGLSDEEDERQPSQLTSANASRRGSKGGGGGGGGGFGKALSVRQQAVHVR